MPWQTIVNTINLLFFPGFNPGFIVVIISISRYNKHVIINSDFKLVTKHQKAFTIVELLVVIVVIAILAVISFVSYQGISRRAVAVSLQSDLSQASKQIKLYQVDHGFYPSGVETGTNCLKDSLGVVDASYCLKISDGNSLIYSLDTSTNPYGFSLISSNINNMNYIVTNDAAPAEYKVATSPTNLVATVNSATQITLTWSAPSSNGGTSITGYKIYRGIALGAETLLTTTGNVLTYTNTGLNPNTDYYYKITAINGDGDSKFSNNATSKTSVAEVPSAPNNFVTTANSSTQITLTWSAPSSSGSSSVTNYKIYRGTSSGGETLIATVGNVLTYANTGLVADTTYYYKVLAVNSFGDGVLSNEASSLSLYGGIDGYTKLMLHGDDLTDSELTPKIVTNSATPVTISTDYSKFGGKSLYFNGSSNLSIANSADWNRGSGDYTIDGWFFGGSGASALISCANMGVATSGFALTLNSSNFAYLNGKPTFEFVVTGWSIPGAWTHIAVTIASGTYRVFKNGVMTNTGTFAAQTDTALPLLVGFDAQGSSTYRLVGLIDELRISKGIARWTSNFTPPTKPYTN